MIRVTRLALPAALALLFAVIALVQSCAPAPTVSIRPAATPVAALLEITTTVRPSGLVGPAALSEAITVSPWPVATWGRLEQIAYCEAPLYSPEGRLIGVDELAEGDDGLAQGVLQIRADQHRHLARSLDLFDLRDNLIAGYIVYVEAGRSFAPWSCAR